MVDHRVRCCLLPFVCCLVAGCSDLAPAAGTVWLDDKPLPQATVSFHQEGSSAPAQASLTGEDGSFVMTTRKYGDGVLPGKYKVTVVKTANSPQAAVPIQPAPPPTKEGEAPTMPGGMAALVEQIRRNRSAWGIPPAYWAVSTTPFTIEIPKGGNKNIELRIDSKAAGGKK